MNTTFWKEHFDHILLTVLGITGAFGALWATAHGFEKMSEWLTIQASGCIAALLMRMQGPKNGGPTPPPLVPGPSTA